ncbi:MAG: SGNH/GDSL hydrolase family protein [Pseudorhodoplanes sp.]|nr:SGNH/GDSL hydrolase family protein [Pseudorhodoplanes sp.]
MKTLLAVVLTAVLSAGPAFAAEPEPCDVPAYLVVGDRPLKRVMEAARQAKRLDIVVVGTGSSTLGGADGAAKAYPARLQAALQEVLPDVAVTVRTYAKSRQSAAEMLGNFDKLLVDGVPSLVVWQTGTVDAMRGIDAEEFRSVIDKGIEALHARGADVVLMNMQYSPRTETMIQFDPYADAMRAVALEREVPLFDRLNLMRYWNDTGAFDLYSAAKDNALASRVHDCLGRALALLVAEAAELEKSESKTSQ